LFKVLPLRDTTPPSLLQVREDGFVLGLSASEMNMDGDDLLVPQPDWMRRMLLI
jgi:hypothetical protein